MVVGLGAGAAAGALSRRPAVVPSAAPAPPAESAPPSADPEAQVFAQPLDAGCATETAVWVVADGGGIARFADGAWALADGTLRTLVAAACGAGELIAVGPGGRVVVVDERARTVQVDAAGVEDLLAVSASADGAALAVGTRGTVLNRAAGWSAFARGIEEDLHGVSVGTGSAWLVGAGGAAYRLEERGWRALPTGRAVTLQAVAASGPEEALAVGDAGTVLRWQGGWMPIASGVGVALRAVVRVGGIAYAGGDEGVALRLDLAGDRVERIDLGTRCPVRSVFARGEETWFVASGGGRAAVWRRTATDLRRWGDC